MLAQADMGGPTFGSVIGVRTFSDPGVNTQPGTQVFPLATINVPAAGSTVIITPAIAMAGFGWPGSSRQALVMCEIGCQNGTGANAGNGGFILEIDGGAGFIPLRNYLVTGLIPTLGAGGSDLYVFSMQVVVDRGVIQNPTPTFRVSGTNGAGSAFDVIANQSRLTIFEIA